MMHEGIFRKPEADDEILLQDDQSKARILIDIQEKRTDYTILIFSQIVHDNYETYGT